ncbi:pilus assembly protein PilM [Candidatus Parcubacteria bacterium]|nr:pilus assembly protein PilM [Candidatus Parcubacteria bacterium]
MAQYSFLDFFPTPEFLLITSTGVTISDTNVYVVEFKRSGKGDRGLILSRLGSVPLPEGAVENGVIYNKEAVIKALTELREHHSFRYVRATFPEEKAYLFTTEVDKVSSSDLRDAIAFTIEENAPVHLSESVFEYDIISETEEKVRAAVTVLPTEAVASYTEVFEAAGIEPVGFDITPQAISRALIPRGDKRTFLILNVGEKKTGLYVVEDGVVQFSSTVTLGAGEGPDYPDLDGLRMEVRKLFGFWDTQIDKVILSGRGAGKHDFIERLMDEMGVEYAVGDIWASASPIEKYVPDIPFTTSLSYAAPVGTALPSKRAKMFGLLPPEARERVQREYRLRKIAVWALSVAGVLFLAAGLLVPAAIISSARQSNASQKTSTLLSSESVQTSESLKRWVLDTNKKITFLSPDEDSDKPYELFLTILNRKSSGIRIVGLSFDKEADKKGNETITLIIRGVASDRQALLNFENTLNALNRFTKANVPVSDFTKNKNITFELTLSPLRHED